MNSTTIMTARNTSDLKNTINSFYATIFVNLTETRNSQRENLLHHACKLNKSQQIESLINMGCRLCQQDIQGRTPLHIVIEKKHKESVEIFRNLFQAKNSSRITNSQGDLKKIFNIYDHQGYTVLHKAVLHDMSDLLEHMLGFCLKHNINVVASEVLGCGDSILHLAVKGNLLNVAKIIYDYMPRLLYVKNYAGEKPTELESITMEMKILLKMNLKRI